MFGRGRISYPAALFHCSRNESPKFTPKSLTVHWISVCVLMSKKAKLNKFLNSIFNPCFGSVMRNL